MTCSNPFVVALSALTLAACSDGQASAQAGEDIFDRTTREIGEADANGDGEISGAELARNQYFRASDRNGDGRVGHPEHMTRLMEGRASLTGDDGEQPPAAATRAAAPRSTAAAPDAQAVATKTMRRGEYHCGNFQAAISSETGSTLASGFNNLGVITVHQGGRYGFPAPAGRYQLGPAEQLPKYVRRPITWVNGLYRDEGAIGNYFEDAEDDQWIIIERFQGTSFTCNRVKN